MDKDDCNFLTKIFPFSAARICFREVLAMSKIDVGLGGFRRVHAEIKMFGGWWLGTGKSGRLGLLFWEISDLQSVWWLFKKIK